MFFLPGHKHQIPSFFAALNNSIMYKNIKLSEVVHYTLPKAKEATTTTCCFLFGPSEGEGEEDQLIGECQRQERKREKNKSDTK